MVQYSNGFNDRHVSGAKLCPFNPAYYLALLPPQVPPKGSLQSLPTLYSFFNVSSRQTRFWGEECHRYVFHSSMLCHSQIHWPILSLTLTLNPPPHSYCYAVSQGLFESLLGWSQHVYTHMIKAVWSQDLYYNVTCHMFAIFVMNTNSNSAFCQQMWQTTLLLISWHNTILVQKMYRIC